MADALDVGPQPNDRAGAERAADSPAGARHAHDVTTQRVGAAGWAVGARLVGLAASAGVAIVLSRSLGPAEFGVFGVATSVAIAGSLAASGGLNRVVLRDLASSLAEGRVDEARSTLEGGALALLLYLPLGAFLTAAVGWLVVEGGARTIGLTTALAVLLGVLLVASDVLRPFGEYRLANLTTGQSGGALVAFGFAALALASVTRPHTADEALLLNIAAAGFATVATLGALVVRSRGVLPEAEHQRPRATTHLFRVGAPFLVMQVAMFLNGQVDLWVSGATLTDTETGLYAAALRLMNIIRIPLNAAQLTLVAVIPALYTLGRLPELQRRLRRAASFATVPALLALVPCVLLAGPVIALIFGGQYRDAGPVLAALALGQIVNVLTGLCGITLTLCGEERLMVVIAVVSALVSTLADLVAARLWGLEALAIASAATTAASFILMWWFAHSRLGLWTHPAWRWRDVVPAPAASGADSSGR